LANSIDLNQRDGKLAIFQVVKFPNNPCEISGSSKNGTCYTAEECSNRGGKNEGSCADGYGVCCSFSMGCGGTVTENCTYFEVSTGQTPQPGGCRSRVCKCAEDICQIRLDFNTFVISGPSTVTLSVGGILNGEQVKAANGIKVSNANRCLTDTFTITNQNTVPVICGTNTGFHVYFDASDACHDLDFALGQNAVGLASVATRQWNIKISQYSCNYENLAPTGCNQWFYGSGAMNLVKTYNFDGGRHLADQRQTICVRREAGNCRICWSADAKTDVGVSGDTNIAGAKVKGEACCAYDVDGKAAVAKAYDCIMIPGAVKAADDAVKPQSICGTKAGLVSATGDTSVTLCSRASPFRVVFSSDTYEMAVAAINESAGGVGFKLRYFQTTC